MILAGGIGSRLDAGVPKQFYKINNKELLTKKKHNIEEAIIVKTFVSYDKYS